MKSWIKFVTPVVAATLFTGVSMGQDQKEKLNNKQEKSEEIVIRKKGNKTEKMTIVVDGDNVTINGKPVDEFKGKDITVFKRDGFTNGMQNYFDAPPAPPLPRSPRAPRPPFDPETFSHIMPVGNKAILGILTKKADDGVRVADVTKESAAEKAGLKKDDIITKVGDKEIADPAALIAEIGNHKVGDNVSITYKRDGKINTTTAILSENKNQPFAYNFNNKDFNFEMPEGVIPPMENFNFNFNRKPRIGMQIQDVDEGKGVAVKDVDEESPAAKAGIKNGDVITQVNGKDVAGVDELRNAIKELKEGDTVKFSFRRDGKNQTAEIKIPKRLKTANL